ncbi:MAG: Rpn family recombination-promoting nuclease/putative transposase [Oscillospiraceae bacterium]|nr:Rpn family recombination-promoting nuclease/putative transposase [Oscillospiraceae bacterium]
MAVLNKEHKSSTFTKLFGEPDKLIPLYNAVSGNNYPLDTHVEIKMLDNVLFKGRYNDLSFVIDNHLVCLIEHQSTISQNLPLRLAVYWAKLIDILVSSDNVYSSRLVKIPHPEFIVLYNGEQEFPDEHILRLSDAFEKIPETTKLCGSLELTVKVLNINKGHNENILKRDTTLDEYAIFIETIRSNRNSGMSLEEAIVEAIKQCVNKKILEKFLREHGAEVVGMLVTEWDWDAYVRVQRNEGRLEGREEGIFSVACNLLTKNISIDIIREATGLSIKEIESLQKA